MIDHPLLIVNTGDGKGKTSSAMGTALRAWSTGLSVGVFQFIKGRWKTGEHAAFTALAATGGAPIEWQAFGQGFTWLRANEGVDQGELARAGWDHVARQLTEGTHSLYVLDEFTYALSRGWVPIPEVLDTLAARQASHVIITGRGAPAELVDAADLVTTFEPTKHPYQQGIKAQRGIEW